MLVEVTRGNGASEAQAAIEISSKGFTAEAKDYAPGKTEPHRHDHDICLHILEGEFRLGLIDENVVHSCGPGDRLLVPAGTLHFEDHGELRMVVGRRQPIEEQLAANTAKGA